ncbi:LVIVD repeat-containing protein [Asanoa iriomotensis]|uniref:LVIVD repeat-containing protein n=1 Tax=Asanoa iriomotensis TaxID=234613 RepID=A0ABQ4C6I0_9ACTN|nr:hypothetical protein [Asanoa iriomotensis]GIF58381.1 hypothetical protein Air01nite_44760 [Asanoa iriomotensis]
MALTVRKGVVATAAALLVLAFTPGAAAADPDPRIGLGGGWLDAEEAASNLEHLAHVDKPAGNFDPANPSNFSYVASDLAFKGDVAFMGGYNGFTVLDVANPSAPSILTTVVCPGGQGDVSVYGNLLFMSVEETRGRVDCGTNPAVGTRFQGVRVFDISNVSNPQQVAAVQLCRGSHTHSLVTKPGDNDNVYVYVSGTAGVRNDMPASCNNNPASGVDPSRWRIDVIKVPVANPAAAAVVSGPRLFTNPETGAVDGLQNAPQTPRHPSGSNWSPSPVTDACHDITSYPALGLAAGACEGNGILIDISDPANPKRLDEVADPNFAYWHSATINNDGTKVIFTDEWGGGTGARCRDTDLPEWGANAIFDIVDGKMQFRSYYKLPVPQALVENCVAHNGSLLPVPGRDILVQAWYQGGISLMDFTDSAHPKEIAFFDRGPVSPTALSLGGFWSAYWHNGQIYGSEIARGFDTFGLKPSADLSAAEIEAAREVQVVETNPQHQEKFSWAASRATARAKFDQLARTCTTTITGTRNGGLVVDGVTCLDGATVRGAVTVRPGASLLAIDSSFSGAVSSANAAAVHLYNTSVSGAISVSGTTGSLAVVDSTIRGAVSLSGANTPGFATVVAGNQVSGVLSCSGNTPAPINVGAANEVRGLAAGQCAALD